MAPPLSSIKRALQILQLFSPHQPELGVIETSKILRVHKSSISRIMGTLAAEGFLEKDPVSKRYRLGLKLADLGNRALGHYGLRDHARPYMETLGRSTGEIIHLSILDRNEIVYLEKQGEGQALTVSTRIGGRSPAHASAMGKVLLAGLSSKELKDVLSTGPLMRCTPSTITGIPRLLDELDRVRKQGFAIDDEESFSGIRCVAAPISNSHGKVIAALSVTVPKQRMGHQRLKEIRRQIIETAQSISRRVGTYEKV